MAGSVYLITHTASGRVYVGQTINPNPVRRWHGHMCDAGRKTTYAIGNAIKKYGPDAFTFEVIGSASTQDELDNLEKLWIILLNSYSHANGFNIRGGGSRGKIAESTKEKLREARSRQVITAEMYAKGAAKRRGRPRSAEHSEKLSKALKGRIFSEKTRKQMSESAKIRSARLSNRDHWNRFTPKGRNDA